jgi:hypothetical protein
MRENLFASGFWNNIAFLSSAGGYALFEMKPA